jgi:hypothetical protein
MIQRRGGTGFLLEAAQAISIDAELGGQDLDSDVSAQTRISCPIDFAHPAAAQRGEDLVGAESSAGRQGHAELPMSWTRSL